MTEYPDAIETWRHKDGSIRVDHMDAREGDYFGAYWDAPATPEFVAWARSQRPKGPRT